MFRRILSLLFVCVTMFFCLISASAGSFDGSVGGSRSDFYEWLSSSGAGGSFAGGVGGSRDGYEEWVQTLPSSAVDSTGSVYLTGWQFDEKDFDPSDWSLSSNGPSFSAYWSGTTSWGGFMTRTVACYFTVPETGGYVFSGELNLTSSQGNSVDYDGRSVYCRVNDIRYGVRTGVTLFEIPNNSSTFVSKGQVLSTTSQSAPASYVYSKSLNLEAGKTYSFIFDPYVSMSFEPPTLDFVRISGFVRVTLPESITNIYNTETRPISIIGDYGIIGDDGTITKSENQYIVNETNNTIYNPVTNTTTDMSGWTYDYSTRTYTVTLSTGDTQTITYGDEYVTIHEGDTIYNVYYIVNGSGGDTPVNPPETCGHTYTSAVTTEASCTVPGSKTLTCSKCGDVKTEAIPAKGHTWTVLQTVQTSYDESGNLVQQGYTIYECSVCGEQYKDINGTGPPGGETEKDSIWDKLGDLIGSIAGGFMEVIEAVVSKILGYLESLVNTINEKIGSVVTSILNLFDHIPSLFGGFTAFLAAVFPFLPQEIWDVLLLGVCLLVAAAIIRFFLKR